MRALLALALLLAVSIPSLGVALSLVPSASAATSTLAWAAPYGVDAVTQVTSSNSLSSISCPTATFCAAVDNTGNVVTSADPTGGTSAWTVTNVSPFDNVTSISCPTTSFCAAVDSSGNVITSTDPTGGASAWTVTYVASAFSSISCPSVTFCAAAYSSDVITSTDPTGGASAWSPPTNVDPTGSISAVSCTSATFCAADDEMGNVVTDNGGTWSTPSSIDPGNSFSSISCTSASFCVAGDSAGDVFTYNGSAWSTPANVDGIGTIDSISCPSPSFCEAVDSYGNELTYNGSAWSTPANVDGTNIIWSVSCPTASFCAAVDDSGNVVTSNDPTGAAWSAPVLIDGTTTTTGNSLVSVSCPSTAFCAAVDGAGNVVTSTDPTGGSPTWTVTNIDGTTAFSVISCPSVTFCAAVDSAGNVVTTTDPTGGASAWAVASIYAGAVLISISCPSATFCAAVDVSGHVLTSTNPAGGVGAWSAPVSIDSNTDLASISCPSATFCVAVDGSGYVLTSTNPAGGGAAWSAPVSIDAGDSLTGISCSSATFCATVDNFGNVLTSTNPTGGASAWPVASIDAASNAGLTSISCPSTAFCAALGSAGNVLTSTDPTGGSSAWSIKDIDATNATASISCPSTAFCAAVDHSGNVVTGTAPIAAPSACWVYVSTSSLPGVGGPGIFTGPLNTGSSGTILSPNLGEASVPSGAYAMAYDKTTSTMYVTNYKSAGALTPVDIATEQAGTPTAVGSYPTQVSSDMAGTTPGNQVYVSNDATSPPGHPGTAPNGSVSVLDTTTSPATLSSTTSVGQLPFGSAYDPTNGDTYVPDNLSGQISVIDASTGALVTTISTGGTDTLPNSAVVGESGAHVYVTLGGEGLTAPALAVVNTTTNTITHTVAMPGGDIGLKGIALDTSNGDLYLGANANAASHLGPGAVVVVGSAADTANAYKVVTSIPTPYNDFFLAFNPTTSPQQVMATNPYQGTVTEINPTTNTADAPVAVADPGHLTNLQVACRNAPTTAPSGGPSISVTASPNPTTSSGSPLAATTAVTPIFTGTAGDSFTATYSATCYADATLQVPCSSANQATFTAPTSTSDTAGTFPATPAPFSESLAPGTWLVTPSITDTTNGLSAAGAPYTITVTAPSGICAGTLAVTALSGSSQSASVSSPYADPLVAKATCDGIPLPGAGISWAGQAGTGAAGSFSTTSTVTSASGDAQVTATAGTTAGTWIVTATDANGGNGGQSATFDLANSAPYGTCSGILAVTAVSGSGQSASVSSPYASPLVVKATCDGAALPGAGISWSVTNGASGATGSLSATSSATALSGDAQVKVTAGTTAGAFTVTASAGSRSATFDLAVVAPSGICDGTLAVAAVSGSLQSAQVSSPYADPLVAKATCDGLPLPGAAISFAGHSGTGHAGSLAPTVAVTDASGQANSIATAGTTAGTWTAVATDANGGNGSQAATFDLANTAPYGTCSGTLAVTALSGSSQSASVSSPYADPLVAKATCDGIPLPGATITWAGHAGTAGTGTLSSSSTTTKASGKASVDATAGTTAGTWTVTATDSNGGHGGQSVTFDLANSAPYGTCSGTLAITALSGSGQSSSVSSRYADPLVVRATCDGLPLPGDGIAWAVTNGGSGATGSLSATSSPTSASGDAQVKVTAGSTPGAFTVTASTGGRSVIFDLSVTSPPAKKPTSKTPTTTTPPPPTKKPPAKKPPVTTPPPGSTPGTPPSSGTHPTTPPSGTTPPSTGTPPSGTTPPSTGTPPTTATCTAPLVITAVSGSGQSAAVSARYARPLVVRVTCAGHPVAHARIVWARDAWTAPPGELSAISSVTNASGDVTVRATAGQATGSWRAAAQVTTATGGAESAAFTLGITAHPKTGSHPRPGTHPKPGPTSGTHPKPGTGGNGGGGNGSGGATRRSTAPVHPARRSSGHGISTPVVILSWLLFFLLGLAVGLGSSPIRRAMQRFIFGRRTHRQPLADDPPVTL
ncbi:MAG: hypothetical protein ACYCVV_00040 [Acidimicrobiales bacterium]